MYSAGPNPYGETQFQGIRQDNNGDVRPPGFQKITPVIASIIHHNFCTIFPEKKQGNSFVTKE